MNPLVDALEEVPDQCEHDKHARANADEDVYALVVVALRPTGDADIRGLVLGVHDRRVLIFVHLAKAAERPTVTSRAFKTTVTSPCLARVEHRALSDDC